MPVYTLKCPKCEHQFQGLVLEHTQEPKEWVCSRCGSHDAKPVIQHVRKHPLESPHGSGCPCCGGTNPVGHSQ